MPMWAGLLAQLVDFLLVRLHDVRFDRTPEDTKGAAIALLKLHEAMVMVAATSGDFLEFCEPFVSGERPRLYRAAFAGLETQARMTSKAFNQALTQLHRLLIGYEKSVALMLFGVVSPRPPTSRFLEAMRFELVPTEESVFAIGYTAPTPALHQFDFENFHDVILNEAPHFDLDGKVGHAYKYSTKDPLLNLVESRLVSGVIQADRWDQLSAPYNLVKAQLNGVQRVRDTLTHHIQGRISISDLVLPVWHYASRF
jgi:hypothetical protein